MPRRRQADNKPTFPRTPPQEHKHIVTEAQAQKSGQIWHRRAVGGTWEKSGEQLLAFLVDNGMAPHHRLLDVGCGSLRGGVRFIDYLEPGNYYGLEPSLKLLGAGIGVELPLVGLTADKRPNFLINKEFDLSTLRDEVEFDFAFANSVFTHMPPHRVKQGIRAVLARTRGPFFATFYEAKKLDLGDGSIHGEVLNYWIAQAKYPQPMIKEMVQEAGGTAVRIGAWHHSRRAQKMWKITSAA